MRPRRAGRRGVAPRIDAPGAFAGEKVLVDRAYDGGSPAFQGRLRIAQAIRQHDGVTLAGCTYRLIFKGPIFRD